MNRFDPEPGTALQHDSRRISRDDKVLGIVGLIAGILMLVAVVVIALANALEH